MIMIMMMMMMMTMVIYARDTNDVYSVYRDYIIRERAKPTII